MRSALAQELRSRLPEREQLTHSELYLRFWSSLPEQDIRELFEVIEQEFAIPAGLLRPDDDLDRLLAPLSIRKPLWWFRVEPALEDATGELSHQLSERMRAQARSVSSTLRVHSIDELARAWCGLVPS